MTKLLYFQKHLQRYILSVTFSNDIRVPKFIIPIRNAWIDCAVNNNDNSMVSRNLCIIAKKHKHNIYKKLGTDREENKLVHLM